MAGGVAGDTKFSTCVQEGTEEKEEKESRKKLLGKKKDKGVKINTIDTQISSEYFSCLEITCKRRTQLLNPVDAQPRMFYLYETSIS